MDRILYPLFDQRLQQLGFQLTSQQWEQVERYYQMLIEANQTINLTTITQPQPFGERHFLDSLLIDQVLDLKSDWRLIDVGTGAGFPGIPLKIVFPQLTVVLLDSLHKRIDFLNRVATELELEQTQALCERAEVLARQEAYRQRFDVCVSRAVSNLSTLAELCLPFVKIGGYFVAYKAENSESEIEQAETAINKLGGRMVKQAAVVLTDQIVRKFVVVEKVENTDKQYPRRTGIPNKRPL